MTEITHETIAKRVRIVRRGGLILALAVGIFAAIGRGNAYQEANRMLAQGTAVEATVIQKRHWLERGRKGRQHDRYALTYEFLDGSQHTNTKELRVNEEFFSSHNEGDNVSVIYDAARPATNELRSQYERDSSILRIIGDIATVIGFVLIFTFIVAFLVDRKLRKRLAAQAAA